jgi:hypothetical protein
MEADGRFGGRGFVGFLHKLADGVEKCKDLVVVVLQFAFEFIELGGELVVGDEEFAQFDESADDEEAGVHGQGTVEDCGGHDGAVFGEGVRAVLEVLSVWRFQGRNLRP